MLLNNAFELFLEYQLSKGNSEATLNYYRINISRFINFIGDIQLGEISISALRDYVQHLQGSLKHENNLFANINQGKLSSVSIQSYLRAVRAFLGWLYEEELIEIDYRTKLKLPKATKKQKKILTDDEIKNISNSFNIKTASGCRNACIFSLLVGSGLRLSEVAGIRLQDIDFDSNVVKVLGKGGKERTVPFAYYTKRRLVMYIENFRSEADTDMLFLSGESPITANAIKSIFRRISSQTGIKVNPHLCRHTFATKYIIEGGNMFALQQILGHTTLEMVRNYCHLAEMHSYGKAKELSVLDKLFAS